MRLVTGKASNVTAGAAQGLHRLMSSKAIVKGLGAIRGENDVKILGHEIPKRHLPFSVKAARHHGSVRQDADL